MSEEERNKELEKEMDDLAKGFPKKTIVAYPPGYFDQFPDKVMEEWGRRKSVKVKSVFALSRWLVAAMILGLLVGGLFILNRKEPVTDLQITGAEANQYILEYISEFEPLLLQEAAHVEEDPVPGIEPEDARNYILEELQEEEIEQLF